MRMTRIVYAFRNRVWPKPMEGLDLFIPSVKSDESSSSSEDEEEIIVQDGGAEDIIDLYSTDEGIDLNASDSDCQFIVSSKKRAKRPRRAKAMAKLAPGSYSEVLEGGEGERGREVGVRRNFEIEKSQGLKLTLKKSLAAVVLGGGARREVGYEEPSEPLKVS